MTESEHDIRIADEMGLEWEELYTNTVLSNPDVTIYVVVDDVLLRAVRRNFSRAETHFTTAEEMYNSVGSMMMQLCEYPEQVPEAQA